ncbi:MAG TPA: hypothetical protein VNW15_02415 [Rhizomicrobium sp.]|jgi:hypothetical protein|nr:hypothetical protein [Rhizomicrobium sp.]
MRGFPAKTGLKRSLFLAFSLTAGLSLAACSDIGSTIDSLFGGDTQADAGPPPDAGVASNTAPPTTAGAPPTASAPVASSGGLAPMVTIMPVAIEAGADTGTAVNKTIQTVRAQVSGLEGKLAANAQRLNDLRNSGAASASSYQGSKAQITTRLQVGTTKGNPELVSQWNIAQTSLDAMAGNINALNALGTDVSNDSSNAHFALDQIGATFNVSGAVDEDHRQLSLLQDETSQTLVMIDRLLSEVSDAVQRQTSYVANERGSLTVLAGAIKNGELYGGTPGVTASSATGGVQLSSAGTPLVVIRFDHPGVDYQQVLYAALNQALQSRPNAGFEVVAVSPTRGTAASVQIAQTTAKRHAQEVMRSMTDMGVPAARMGVASATDPGAADSEVRVFVR